MVCNAFNASRNSWMYSCRVMVSPVPSFPCILPRIVRTTAIRPGVQSPENNHHRRHTHMTHAQLEQIPCLATDQLFAGIVIQDSWSGSFFQCLHFIASVLTASCAAFTSGSSQLSQQKCIASCAEMALSTLTLYVPHHSGHAE